MQRMAGFSPELTSQSAKSDYNGIVRSLSYKLVGHPPVEDGNESEDVAHRLG